jgi:hypothetical protein
LYFLAPDNGVSRYVERITDTITITPRPLPQTPPDKKRTVHIRGRIMKADGQPAANVLVRLLSEPRYTVTDELGEFFFLDVEPGAHTISALQGEVVLASIQVDISRADLADSVNTMVREDGAVIVQISAELTQICLHLSFAENTLTVVGAMADTRPLPLLPDGQNQPGPAVTPPPITPPPVTPPVVTPPVTPPPVTPPVVTPPVIPPPVILPPVTPPPPVPPGRPSRPPSAPNRAPDISADDPYGASTWVVATPVDIFKPRPGNRGVSTVGGETVIAPGAAGSYTFRLHNPESFTVEYLIKLQETDENSPALPLFYRLKKGLASSDEYIGGLGWHDAAEMLTPLLLLEAGAYQYYTLEWQWITVDDATDTALGMQTHHPVYILNIIVNASFR